MDTEFLIKVIGGMFTVGATVFGYGKVQGARIAKRKAAEDAQTKEGLALVARLALIEKKALDFQETLRELEKSDAVSTQKIKTLEGQMKAIFSLIHDQGEKLNDFFNKMYDLKGR